MTHQSSELENANLACGLISNAYHDFQTPEGRIRAVYWDMDGTFTAKEVASQVNIWWPKEKTNAGLVTAQLRKDAMDDESGLRIARVGGDEILVSTLYKFDAGECWRDCGTVKPRSSEIENDEGFQRRMHCLRIWRLIGLTALIVVVGVMLAMNVAILVLMNP